MFKWAEVVGLGGKGEMLRAMSRGRRDYGDAQADAIISNDLHAYVQMLQGQGRVPWA